MTTLYLRSVLPGWQGAVLRNTRFIHAAAIFGLVLLVLWLRGKYRMPLWWPTLFVGLLLLMPVLRFWAHWRRERLIREAPLPRFLRGKVSKHYPHLERKDLDLVERGLRQFFLACHRSRGRFVAMPSRAVDVMWHEFILHTQAYRDWCGLAMGRFLHHTPAEALGRNARHNDGLRRAWFWACKDEAIDPRQPSRLPLLFALDAKLAIPNGFRYVPNCGGPVRTDQQGGGGDAYCATSFGDGSAAGDGGGFGGEAASDGGSGGGDGCGGGCGGGD